MADDVSVWRTYEEVAVFVLGQIKSALGIVEVEGKQKVSGKISGTEWELDAKAILAADGKFLVVECRRYTSSRLNQEKIAALAYR